MNATKFIVLLFIGVIVAKTNARKLEEMSKNTDLNLSDPKATVKGVGAELETQVYTYAGAYGDGYVSASTPRSSVTSSGTGSADTGGYVTASGPDSSAESNSGAGASGYANGAAGPNSATGNSGGGGSASSDASGETGDN